MNHGPTVWDSPPRRVADLCRRAADDLDQAINTLVAWHVPVPRDSRLRAAARLLRFTAQRGVLPLNLGRRRRALSALSIAVDYTAIASQLPASPVASLRKELAQSVRGGLTSFGGPDAALQLQSQHWVGAFLRSQGLGLDIPRFSHSRPGKIPDFVTTNHMIQYGIEVKRPRSRSRFLSSITNAASQLADFGVDGAIALDASDLLRSLPPSRTESGFVRLVRAGHKLIWNHTPGLPWEHRPGFTHVLMLAILARGAWHQRQRVSIPNIRLLNFSSCTSFARATTSLKGRRAEWLRAAFNDGFRQMGGWMLAGQDSELVGA